MCRLAFIPGRAKITKAQMLNLLDDLEVSFGGDGNGYVAISPTSKNIKHSKAVKLNNERIVNETYKLIQRGWALYYHTRKISVGWSSDTQCHPFKISGPKFKGYLCHNGTWFEGSTFAKYFKCGSDTAALAKLIGTIGIQGLKDRELFPSSGVFLLYGAGPNETPTHKVIKVSGDLEYCNKTGIWASEFDNAWEYKNQCYKVAYGSHMLEKPAPSSIVAEILNNPVKVKTKGFAPKLNPWRDKVSPLWIRDKYCYDHNWEEIDREIDSTYVERNLLK